MTAWRLTLFSWLKLVRLRLTGAPLLIVERPGGIGDLLCVLPAAAALRAQHPGARLVLFTARAFIPLVELSGVADCVVASETRGLARLRSWLHPHLDSCPLLPDEQTPPQPRARIPLTEEFARALGVRVERQKPVRLTPSIKDIAAVKVMLARQGITSQPFIVAHSGPTWAVKQWPLESWASLTSRFQQEQGMRIIQTGTSIHAGSQGVPVPRIEGAIDWTGSLTLPETLALLTLARLFVGVDSGLLHLAGSTDTPAIGLFGPTDPECILPPRAHVRGVKAALACIGCHHHPSGPQHWRTGCPHSVRCMSELSVETVYQQSLALLA